MDPVTPSTGAGGVQPNAGWVTDRDLLLKALVWQAMDIKAWAPQYLPDAVRALVESYVRHPLTQIILGEHQRMLRLEAELVILKREYEELLQDHQEETL